MKNLDYRYLIDDLPYGFSYLQLVVDSTGHVGDMILLDANRKFLELTDLQDTPWHGRSMNSLIPGFAPAIIQKSGSDPLKYRNRERISMEFFQPEFQKWFHLSITAYDQHEIVMVLTDISRTKKTEEEFTNSEKRFRSLYENATIGLYRTTPSGEIIMANPALVKILGYSGFDEIALRNLEEEGFDPEYTRKAFKEAIEKNGEIRGLESLWMTRDQRKIYIRESARAEKDEKGNVIYYEGTVEDITERKVAEMQISELNDIFLELGIDPQHNTEIIVRKACEILRADFAMYNELENGNRVFTISGYNTPFHYSGQPLSEVLHYLLDQEGAQEYPRFVEHSKDTFSADPLVRNSGVRSMASQPVFITGKKIGWIGVGSCHERGYSSTETSILSTLAKALSLEQKRYQIEKKLKESESKYRSFVRNFHGIAFRGDLEFRPFFFHGNVETITGYRECDFISGTLNWRDVIHPDDLPNLIEETRDINLKPDISLEKEYRIIRSDGEIRWVKQVVRNLSGRSGKPEFVEGVIYDSTGLKEFEENLKKAKTEAEEASRAKTQFLANMSHEIRTPLHAILGFSEILLLQESDRNKLEMIHTIIDSGDQLLHLINDLLDLSRIESGVMKVYRAEFNLVQLARETISYFHKQTDQKGLDIKLKTEGLDDVTLVGDPYKVKQIMVNLISNAVKFTEKGSIRLNISAEKEGSHRCIVNIHVRDTGIGIDREMQGTIFDEFRQLDDYLTKKEKGVGLGLTIVRKLVSILNGTVDVESEKGKGSTFMVRLPLEISKVTIMESSEKSSENLQPGKLSDLSILLAEDNEANQFLIEALAKSRGWKLKVVSNGKDALHEFDTGKYHLILMDVQMPVMDGYEATRLIRKREIETGKHVPIIALTAYAMKSDRDECINAGMDDYIPKPFSREEFFRKVEETFERTGK
ncbi:MAG: response regulator [Bacteroidales bacterium]|nr:response regulator [Bacteroidales bacterium]